MLQVVYFSPSSHLSLQVRHIHQKSAWIELFIIGSTHTHHYFYHFLHHQILLFFRIILPFRLLFLLLLQQFHLQIQFIIRTHLPPFPLNTHTPLSHHFHH